MRGEGWRRRAWFPQPTRTWTKKCERDVFAANCITGLMGFACGCLRCAIERKTFRHLVESFVRKHASQLARPRPNVSPRTLEIFQNHSWPGNIRELENMVKKIVVLGDENLAAMELVTPSAEPRQDRVAEARSYSLKAAARAASREAERELIMKALTRTRWNRKRAAQELQISYKSLLYKLKQIGFEESEVSQ